MIDGAKLTKETQEAEKAEKERIKRLKEKEQVRKYFSLDFWTGRIGPTV